MNDAIKTVQNLLCELEFAAHARKAILGVRLLHETDKQTLDRIVLLAHKSICRACNGYGYNSSGDTCGACDGAGSK